MPYEDKKDHDYILPAIGLSLFLIGSGIAGVYNYVHRHERRTQATVNLLAKRPMDDLPSSATLSDTDDWGHSLRFDRHATENEIVQTIVSAGQDGVFGTSDDITGKYVSVNGARFVGKWVGSRAKEFVKGLREGKEEPTRFEKLSQTSTTKGIE